MKRLASALPAVILIAVVAGCLPSLNETYVKEDVVTVTGVEGPWTWLDEDGKPHAPLPWTFGADEILAVDEDGSIGTLDVVYFKVGEHTFLDTTAGDPSEMQVCQWWTLHALPVHMVSRLEIEKDRMTITPMHFGWMKEALESERVKLEHRWLEEDQPLFTATPQQWRAFLLEYGGNTNVFSKQVQYHFVRHRQKPATEQQGSAAAPK